MTLVEVARGLGVLAEGAERGQKLAAELQHRAARIGDDGRGLGLAAALLAEADAFDDDLGDDLAGLSDYLKR